MSKRIYLDNSATARPSEKTVAKMLPFFHERWGAASSPHAMGQELYPALEESLQSIYTLLGAKETEGFVFTSSGAEAVNHVFQAVYHDVTRLTGKNQYITSNIDEAPSMMAISRLEEWSCLGKMVQANSSGRVVPEAIAEIITPRTALVSLSWANGITGVINPLAEIAALCHEKGVLLHVDATHVLGKLYFNHSDIAPSFLTFNGENFHAPKGTGGLYIKEGVKCSGFILGGMDQGGKRAGGLNVPLLVGLGEAAHEALDARDLVCTEVARLRDLFEVEITSQIKDTQVFFQDQERLPHVSAIAFPGISNEALLYSLNRKGLFASIGGGNFQQIGLLLMASGIQETLAHSSLSFSFSRETTEDEVNRAVEIIKECVAKLRQLSSAFFGGVH
jgi:cysteine desulfurase